MKYFGWNEEKNEQIKAERGVSFEEVITAISEGRILAHYSHPNSRKYSGQTIYVIEVNNYAYLVPCVEDDEKLFLKTIIPSRKATKHYIINRK